MGATHSSNMRTTTLFVLFAIAGVAVCAPLGQTDMTEVFATFKADFNKLYPGLGEEAKRFKIFSDNVNLIRDHNANKAATLGYTMGINQFSDHTPAEYKNLLGYKAEAKNLLGANPIFEANITNLAASFDWTTKGAVTPVKNQKLCGGCWAFSATGALEGALFIKNNKLISLSEQELIDCVPARGGHRGCGGSAPQAAFAYAEKSGDDLEKTYPYVAKGKPYVSGTCNKRLVAKADGVKRITGSTDVKPNSCVDLMAAVQKQPVSVAIEADQPGFMNYASGIFSGTCGTALDHAVLVVGYGTDGADEYWKVKNSWGTTWGDQGYIRMKKSCASNGRQLLGGHGGGGNSGGTCGILMDASFPNV